MPGTERRARGGPAASALLGMLAVAVIAGVMVAAAVTPAIALTGTTASGGLGAFEQLPADLAVAPLDQKTEIYAKKGDQDVRIASFYAQNREVVGWDDVSAVVKNAAVAGEDVRFYEHGGVDPVGIVRATLGNLGGDDLQGASTITQQYVKNVCVQEAEDKPTARAVDAAYEVCTDPTVGRKLREARLAIALEKRYSKQEILLGYLNIAGFGGRTYGIQAAAKYYYDRDAKDLSIAQAASLMAIVNNPEALRLDDEDHFAANTVRRDYILGVELKNGLITRAQHDEAVATRIDTTITPVRSGCSEAGDAAFFCDYVRRTMLSDPAFGATRAERLANLQRSGAKVYTTLDLDLQQKAQRAMEDWVPGTASFDVGGAGVSVGVGTGRIVSMVQNRPFSDEEDPPKGRVALNYAAGDPLSGSGGFQPGSTFKVFTLLDWLAKGHTLNETVDSEPGTRSDFTACGEPYRGVPYRFKNDAPGEGGAQSVLTGTARSINGTFVGMAQQLDLCDIQQLAEDFGVTPVRGEANPKTEVAFTIGGAYTVSPVAVAAAYAGIANHGEYCSPVAIEKVVKSDGSQLETPGPACKQVVPAGVADAAVYAMRGVLTGGTASGDRTDDGVFEFGKTGTTDEARDTWMTGASSKVATSVWIGNARGDANLRQRSFPNPCFTSGSGRAADARHCVWKQIQTAANEQYGGATDWTQPEQQYLTGSGAAVQDDQQDAQQQDEVPAGAVPDVTGLTKPAAAEALVAAGFAWAYGADVPGDAAAGTVVSTEPAAGTQAAPHSQIVIHGSAGPTG